MIAHRGGSPENKIEGFTKLMNTACKMFEVDVRLSKDEHPIVIHDCSIKRITGRVGNIADMMLDELKTYEIPSFEDVIKWLSIEGNTLCIAVELKDLKNICKNFTMLRKVIEISRTHHIERRMTIVSFDQKILEFCKILNPCIPTGFVYGPVWFQNPIYFCKNNDINQLWLHHKLVTKNIVDSCRCNNIELVTWTVNEEKEKERLISLGIKHIVSDILF
jgi:glycerophosphoryl diester phosphodiesterase